MVMQPDLDKTKIFSEIAVGLKAKPAYLLYFGICSLFLLGGIGTGVAGIFQQDKYLATLGFCCFALSLIITLFVIKQVESPQAQESLQVQPVENSFPILKREGSISFNERYGSFPNSFPESLEERLVNSREVWLLGIHQAHILIRFFQRIKDKVERGDQFKILLLDPFGSACHMTAMRFPGNIKTNQERERIFSSIRSFSELMENANNSNIEIRTIDFLLPYGGFMFDPSKENGIVYIQRYTFRTQGGSRKPKFVYENPTEWFKLYKTEINEMWNLATPWTNNNEMYDLVMGRSESNIVEDEEVPQNAK